MYLVILVCIQLNPWKSVGKSASAMPLSSKSKDWVAKFLGLGPAFHHTSGVGGGIIQNTAG